MGQYDVQQVCLNGHQITASYNNSSEFRKKYCPSCGKNTIHQCPNCNHYIQGHYKVDGVIGFFETSVPTHCSNCGTRFPWAGFIKTSFKNIKYISITLFKILKKWSIFQKIMAVIGALASLGAVIGIIIRGF